MVDSYFTGETMFAVAPVVEAYFKIDSIGDIGKLFRTDAASHRRIVTVLAIITRYDIGFFKT